METKYCYPDTHVGETAICQYVYNGNLAVNANKEFFASINPVLHHHITQLSKLATSAAIQFTGVTHFNPELSFQNTGTGIKWPKNGLITAANIPGIPISLTADSDGAFTLPALTADSTLYTRGTGDNYTPGYMFKTGGTWSAVTYTTDGTAVTIPQATEAVKLWYKSNASTSIGSVTQVTLSLYLNVSAGATNVYQYNDVTNYQDLVTTGDIFEEYRVVAMSALVSFQGNTLQDGGNIACRYLEGGENPFDLGWIDYDSIASLSGSYEAPVKKGAYGFWTPTDEKDMQFRAVDTTNDDGDLPSLVVAGTVPDESVAKVRLRVCMIVEAKSFKPYCSVLPRTINPSEILHATLALKDEPRWTENPKHKSFIKGLIARAQQLASNAYSAYQTLAPVALPLAKMAATALL